MNLSYRNIFVKPISPKQSQYILPLKQTILYQTPKKTNFLLSTDSTIDKTLYSSDRNSYTKTILERQSPRKYIKTVQSVKKNFDTNLICKKYFSGQSRRILRIQQIYELNKQSKSIQNARNKSKKKLSITQFMNKSQIPQKINSLNCQKQMTTNFSSVKQLMQSKKKKHSKRILRSDTPINWITQQNDHIN